MISIKFLFLLAITAGLAQNISWQAPPDMEDGYYALNFPESSGGVLSPVIERIEETDFDIPLEIALELDSSNHTHFNALPPRAIPFQISKSACTNDKRSLDPADQSATKQAMYNWCNYGFRFRSSQLMLGVKGTVFYWVCHHGKWKNPAGCSSEEWNQAEKFFDNKCGEHKGGWATVKKLKKTYGRSPREEPIICDNYK